MNDTSNPSPQNPILMAWIIWGALLFSGCIYIGLGVLQAREIKPIEPQMVTAIGGVGLLLLVASIIMRQVLANPQRWLASGKSSAEMMNTMFPLPIPLMIVTWAMAESTAVFGLILTFMSGDTTYVFALGGASCLTMLLVHRPARWRIEDLQSLP